jgi:hypothetical protein
MLTFCFTFFLIVEGKEEYYNKKKVHVNKLRNLLVGKVKLYRSITGATILMIPHPSYRIIPHTRAANHYLHQGEQSSTKYLNNDKQRLPPLGLEQN